MNLIAKCLIVAAIGAAACSSSATAGTLVYNNSRGERVVVVEDRNGFVVYVNGERQNKTYGSDNLHWMHDFGLDDVAHDPLNSPLREPRGSLREPDSGGRGADGPREPTGPRGGRWNQ